MLEPRSLAGGHERNIISRVTGNPRNREQRVVLSSFAWGPVGFVCSSGKARRRPHAAAETLALLREDGLLRVNVRRMHVLLFCVKVSLPVREWLYDVSHC